MGILQGPCHIAAVTTMTLLPFSFCDHATTHGLDVPSRFRPEALHQRFVYGSNLGPLRLGSAQPNQGEA